MTNCPTRETIEDLLANRLPADRAEQVRAHVAGCAACQQSLRGDPPPSGKYPFLSPPQAAGELGWLGPYRIVGVLGEGGMSFVFDAEEPVLQRRVALKVLKPEITDAVARERFLREARVVASLPSDHVVHLYAADEENGVPYMAMEKLQGESLATRLTRDRWLPVVAALQIAREAAEGLAVLHPRGIVHRDVKPGNLWLETDSQGRFKGVKLIDFGVARQSGGAESGLTLVGQVIGTPVYMAPEQAVGNPIDGRADLYSLGCVLYRMITGHVPFEESGPDTIAVLQAVIKGEAPKVSEVAPNLSPAVAELIGQLMERDPDRRPASAAAVVERLRQLETEERSASSKTQMLQALPTTSTRRGPRQVQVLSVALGGVAILAALVVGAVTAYYKFWPDRTDDDGQPGKSRPVAKGEPIKVGVLFSQKGTTWEHEVPIIDAVQMAIDEINEDGGVLGRPVKPVVADGESNERRFEQEATRLIRTDGVAVIFGCWSSSQRRRVTEVCRRNDRMLFYPSGDEGLEESPNLVYLGGTPNQTIIPLVRYLYSASDLRKRKYFLVGSEAVYSYAVNEILEHEITEQQGKVVGKRYLLLGADRSDVKPVVAQIKKSGADCVIVSLDGVASNEALIQALRDEELRPPAVTAAWLSLGESELRRFPADAVTDDYSAACYFESLNTKVNRDFVERFQKKFGETKRVNDVMQPAYASVFLCKKAAEKAGTTDTDKLREALRGLSVDAPDGPLKIADNLHAWRTARIGRIELRENRLDFRVVYQSPEPLAPEPFPSWRSRKEWDAMLKKLFDGWGGAWGKSK